MSYIRCKYCGNFIPIDAETLNMGISQEVCCSCGKKMILKKVSTFSDKLKKVAKKCGELAIGCVTAVKNNYNDSYSELERRGMDYWSDERLKKECDQAPDFSMEKLILMSRLHETNNEDDEC